jgi:outer membrane receptor protein involved in Fe transport
MRSVTIVAAGAAMACLAAAPPAARAQAARPATPAPRQTVQGLTVTAQPPPQGQTLLDRKSYAVTTDLQSTSGTAADVLNNVPSVAVDADGGITLRGDPNITVLVDGKPSAQFTGAARGTSLLQFPASQIERIEVLTNPPAEYRAEGSGGVINIITRKSRRPGVSGGMSLSLGEFGRGVFSGNLALNRPGLKVYGEAGLRHDIRDRETTDRRQVTDPASGLVTAGAERIDEHFHRVTPWIRLSGAADAGDRATVRAEFSDRELTGHRFFDQHHESGPPGGAPDSVSDRHSDGHEWHADNAQALWLDQKLGRPGETLMLGVQRSATREREGYVYRNTSTEPAGPPTHDDLHLSLDLVKTEVSADYDLPLAADRELKLGYDLEDDHNRFDNTGNFLDPVTLAPTVNPLITSHFRYHQQVNAAYGQYQTGLGPWRLLAGLRAEATHVDFLLITGNIPGGRNDFGVYPSVHLDRALGEDGKLTFGLGRRINRPDPEALNPFIDSQDIHNLRAGNPNLRPQETWLAEAGYLWSSGARSLGATAYYREDRNAVTDVVRPVSADTVLSTKQNLPLSRSGGIDFSASGKLTHAVSWRVSGEAFYAQIDATALGAPGLRSTTGVNLKSGLDWRPTAADAFQATFSRTDARLTPQGELAAINIANFGYRRQLRPDLAFVVTLSDAFDGQRQERIITTPLLHDDYVRHQFGRVALASLVLSFGGPSKEGQGFDYES